MSFVGEKKTHRAAMLHTLLGAWQWSEFPLECFVGRLGMLLHTDSDFCQRVDLEKMHVAVPGQHQLASEELN